MPGLDGSGPMGNGPLTGGAKGLCGRRDMKKASGWMGGFGSGRGNCVGPVRGARPFRGRHHLLNPDTDAFKPADEIKALKTRESFFNHRLRSIRKRLRELDKTVRKSADSGESDA